MGEDIRFRFTASGAMEVKSSFKSVAAAGKEIVQQMAALQMAEKKAQVEALELANAHTRLSRAMRASARAAASAAQTRKIERGIAAWGDRDERRRRRREGQDFDRRLAEAADRKKLRDKEAADVLRNNKKLETEQVAHQKRLARAQASGRKRFWRGVGAVGRATATGAGLAITGAVGAGIGIVGGAVRDVMSLKQRAAQTAILGRRGGMRFGAGFGPGETMGPEALMARYQNEAIRTGLSSEDIAAGVHRYAAVAGDVQSAVQMMSTMTTAAVATGTSMEDMAKAMEGLQRVFKIKGIKESQEALAAWIGQAKEGGMEMKDMAAFVAELGSGLAAMGEQNTGPRGAKVLGMLTQQAYLATGNPREAVTAVRNVLATLIGKGGQLRAQYGIESYETRGGKKQARRVEDILADYMVKAGGAGGDIEKRAQAMTIFPIRGRKFFMPFLQAMNDAEDQVLKKAKSEGWATEQGKVNAAKQRAAYEAIHVVMEKFMNAGGTWAETLEDFGTMTTQPGAELNKAWEQVKQQVTVALLPAIESIVKKLPELMPAAELLINVLGALADTIAEMIAAVAPEKANKWRLGAAKLKADYAKQMADAYEESLPPEAKRSEQQKAKLTDLRAKEAEASGALATMLEGPKGKQLPIVAKIMAGEANLGEVLAMGAGKTPLGLADDILDAARALGPARAAYTGTAAPGVPTAPIIGPQKTFEPDVLEQMMGQTVAPPATMDLGYANPPVDLAPVATNSDEAAEQLGLLGGKAIDVAKAFATAMTEMGRAKTPVVTGQPPGSP